MATNTYGLWYKDGEEYYLEDYGCNRHEEMVLKEPEMFGLTKEQVTKLSKGKDAEDKLRIAAIKNGWFRVRWYNNTCTIQFEDFKKQFKEIKELMISNYENAIGYENWHLLDINGKYDKWFSAQGEDILEIINSLEEETKGAGIFSKACRK